MPIILLLLYDYIQALKYHYGFGTAVSARLSLELVGIQIYCILRYVFNHFLFFRVYIHVYMYLQIMDTLVHGLLSTIQRLSFIQGF